jgi:hypothetical protein
MSKKNGTAKPLSGRIIVADEQAITDADVARLEDLGAVVIKKRQGHSVMVLER